MNRTADRCVEIAIVGGGLVGLALACALARAGLRPLLVEPRPPQAATAPDSADWDSRVYAISPGSATFLHGLQAWPEAARACPVEQMRVHGDRPGGFLRLSAAEAGVARLATIIEQRALALALQQRLVALEVPVIASRCVALERGEDAHQLLLADGSRIEARLLVAADGARSWLREAAGMAARVHDYHQVGVVANFACTLPHRHTAFQWFREDGILALLPLPGDRVSMVWSAAPALARALLAEDAVALCARVEAASGAAVGSLQRLTAPAGFPLRLLQSERLVAPRIALVGDAAHNMHPLAGQGVNLGLADARTLAGVLGALPQGADPGDTAWLRRYERSQRERILALTLVVDGLQRLFGTRGEVLARLRNHGLWLADRMLPVKRHLIAQALG